MVGSHEKWKRNFRYLSFTAYQHLSDYLQIGIKRKSKHRSISDILGTLYGTEGL